MLGDPWQTAQGQSRLWVAAPPGRHLLPGGECWEVLHQAGESHTEGASAALILQAIFLVTGQPLVIRMHPLPYVRERFLRVYQNNHGGDGGIP